MGELSSPDPAVAGAVAEAGGAAATAAVEGRPDAKVEKRELMLRAAIELFATRDFHAVLMEDVAVAAGVGKGTIYRYFSTKDDLFVQAVIWASDRAIAHLRAHVERAADTRSKLREVIRHTLRYFKDNDALFRILHHDKVNHTCKDKETIDRKRDEMRGVMETLITDGIAEGAFRAVDAHFCAAVLWGILRTAKSWFGDMELSELTDRIASLFLQGVEA